MTLPPVWPASLPQTPRRGSWTGGPTEARVQFEADYGPPVERARTTADIEIYAAVFPNLSNAARAVFTAFFTADLARGITAFAWRDPVTQDLARWKIIGDGRQPYSLAAKVAGRNALTMTLMKMPGTIWYAPYATQTGELRLPYVVADYENSVFGIDGVKTTAAAVAAVTGKFDLYTTATGGGVTEELAHDVYAGDIPATAPSGVTKIVGFWVGELVPPAFLDAVLLRAVASDWDGSSLVGEGVTLAPITTSPTLSGDKLVFDGTANALTGACSFELNDKTVLTVAKVTATDNARDSIITWTANGTSYIQIEARTAGMFSGEHRTQATTQFGATTVFPATPGNVQGDHFGAVAIYSQRYNNTGGEATIVAGADSAVKTSMTNISRPITNLVIGRSTAADNAFVAMDFYEVLVLDTLDDAVIQSAIDYLAAKYGTTRPLFTPGLESTMEIIGDSIGAGVAAGAGFKWHELMQDRFVVTRDNALATAGAQMSPFGLVSPADDAKINASFSRIAATANFANDAWVIVWFGTNDYGNGDVPIGTIADATENTFYGAMNVGAPYIPTTKPVFFVLPTIRTGETTANSAGHTLQAYRNAITAWVAAQGNANWHVIDMSLCGITEANSGTYTTDGLHPNDAGMALVGAYFNDAVAAIFGTTT